MEDLKGKERAQKEEDAGPEQTAKLDRLVRNGEWKRLDESTEFRALSLEGKVTQLFDAIGNRRKQLTRIFYTALKRQPVKAGSIKDEMHYLDEVNEALSSVLADNIEGQRAKGLKKAA